MEYAYIVVKPDADSKAADIIKELDVANIYPIRYHIQLPDKFWKTFYAVHKGKPFYEKLVNFMSSGTTSHFLAMGENVIERIRKQIGATDPGKAEPFTIRAKYGSDVTRNAIHASDSLQSAQYELSTAIRYFLENGIASRDKISHIVEKIDRNFLSTLGI